MSDAWKAVVVAIGAGMVLEAVILFAMMRQMGELLLNGVGPGRPRVSGGPPRGAVVDVPGHEPAGRPTLVVFTSSECEQCRVLVSGLQQLDALYGPDAEEGHQLDLVAALTDRDVTSREEHARELGSFARTDMLSLMQDWDIPGTPFAVALTGEHRVEAAEVVNGQLHLEMLAVEKLGVLFVPREDDGQAPETADLLEVHKRSKWVAHRGGPAVTVSTRNETMLDRGAASLSRAMAKRVTRRSALSKVGRYGMAISLGAAGSVLLDDQRAEADVLASGCGGCRGGCCNHNSYWCSLGGRCPDVTCRCGSWWAGCRCSNGARLMYGDCCGDCNCGGYCTCISSTGCNGGPCNEPGGGSPCPSCCHQIEYVGDPNRECGVCKTDCPWYINCRRAYCEY